MYIYNLRDAYLTGKTIDETSEYLTSLEYFKKTKNRNFHYMVVIPIGIAFLFVVVMPIIFSILTAFLNYNRDHLPPGKLLSWVGLYNFKKLFTVPIGLKHFLRC